MSILRRREFFIALLIVCSIFIYVPYFFEVPQFMSDVEIWLTETTVVIVSFSVWVGLYTSTRRELVRMQRKPRGWFYGGLLLALAWTMVLSGLLLGKQSTIYNFLQWAFVIPGDSTIYAILVFYLTSAGARAFRMKSLESTLLTFGAVFVLLKQAPLGELLAPWAGPVAIYIQDTLAMAATRVFNVSLAIGSVILAIRLMAGQEMALIGLVKRATGGDE